MYPVGMSEDDGLISNYWQFLWLIKAFDKRQRSSQH